MSSAGAAFLDKHVGKHAVVMFATRSCPFCHRASLILSRMTSDMETYYIDRVPEGDAIFNEIERRYRHSTVPAIFVWGTFVGGCDDMEDLRASGKLADMLSAGPQ